MVLPFLKKRSKIVEIVAARDIVFALAQSGICAAFSRGIIKVEREFLNYVVDDEMGYLTYDISLMQRLTRGYAF